MAKLADESKLMRIKEAAIALIAENGYGEATISSIASKADVAVGYLYRYYSGKEQLVSDMLDEKIRDLAGQLELVMVSALLRAVLIISGFYTN
jgi:AcrR family transcriptional regulator